MSDKFNPVVAATPEFVSGEVPLAAKITVIGAQLKRAAELLEEIIGDAHDQSFPYTTLHNGRLSVPWGFNISTGATTGDVFGRPLEIANLSRLIGPASNLNPREIAGSHTITETIDAGVHEISLRYVPEGTITFSDAVVFANLVATADLLAAAGDYYVDSTGRIFTYTVTASSTATYSYNVSNVGGGANPLFSTFNVIPDPNQIVAGGNGCTVTGPVSGRYTVVTPTATHQQVNSELSSSALSDSDPNYNEQIVLPVALTNNYTAGAEIPQGFLYLKDVTDNVVYVDAQYYYVDQYTVEVANVDLDTGIAAGNKYAVLTVGSDITTSIDDLRIKSKHTHNRLFGEPAVDYQGLAGHLGPITSRGWYSPSTIAGNFAPQYLHRDGYQSSDAGTADGNAMRGDVLLGATTGAPGTYATAINADSFRLYLGPTAEGCSIYKTAFGILSISNSVAEVQVSAATNLSLFGATTALLSATGASSTTTVTNTGAGGQTIVTGSGGGETVVKNEADDVVVQGADAGTGSDNHIHVRVPDIAGSAQIKMYAGSTTAAAPTITDSLVAIALDTATGTGYTSVVSIENTRNANADSILDLHFSGRVDPGEGNTWIRCYDGTPEVRGGLRGTRDLTIKELAAFAVFPAGAGIDSYAPGHMLGLPALRVDGTEFTGAAGFDAADAGNVQFFSGAADFAEWMECGDVTEWYDVKDEVHEHLLEVCRQQGDIGLAEGAVVWVRDRKFWKTGRGTPMVVTRRALLAGNMRDTNADGLGQLLSFCGQVPVLVRDECKDGDLLVPVPDTDFCVAVDPEEITFSEYRSAIGTAWGSDETKGIKKITCAIGIK